MSQVLLNHAELGLVRGTKAEMKQETPVRRGVRRRFMWTIGLVLVLLGGLGVLSGWPTALEAAGRYRYVAPGGSDTANDCIRSSAPCATVQWAVDQAGSGDEIRIATGTYNGVFQRAGFTQTVYITKNLTLRGGFATTNWAISNPAANPTVLNAQGQGRVVYVAGGTVLISGLRLTGGAAANNSGGGLLNENANLTVEDSEIYQNSADFGGGVANISGQLVLSRNRIYSNTIAVAGGGVNIQSGSARIEDNFLYGNSSVITNSQGGAVQFTGGTSVLQRNRIWNNTANYGAGLTVGYGGLVTVTSRNNWMYSNQAQNGSGGGILVFTGTLHSENDTLYGNRALGSMPNGEGGGIYYHDGKGWFTNTLIISNTAGATNGSGGIGGIPGLSIVYSDFFGNTPQTGFTTGTGNRTDQNPLFVNAAAGDLHLQTGSPAIDSGIAMANLSEDVEGHPRPFGPAVDRGADEYLPASSCYARLDKGAVYTNVQQAVDAAPASGGLVLIAGQCAGVVSRSGTSQTVYVNRNMTLRGGYTVTDWTTARYTPTVLNAQGLGRALFLTGTGSITVENLHLTNGRATNGAGLYIGAGISGLFQNNVFYGNVATGDGGAVLNLGPQVVLRYNTFYNNTAARGGAVFADSGGGAPGSLRLSRGAAVAAQEAPQLELRSGAYDPLKFSSQLPAGLDRQLDADQSGLRLVQFPGPILPAWYEAMERAGLEVVTYIPDYAYLVWGKADAVQALAQAVPVRWSGTYQPFFALHPDLFEAREKKDELSVVVQLYRGGRTWETLQALREQSVAVVSEPETVLSYLNVILKVRGDQLDWLAGLQDVVNVEPYLEPQLLDEIQGQILAGTLNGAGTEPVPSPDYLTWLRARGFPEDPAAYPIVDVTDDGIDNGTDTPLHPDFYRLGDPTKDDRLIYNFNWTGDESANGVGGHGNLDAGIVAGYNARTGFPNEDGNGYQYGLGINPFGRIAGSKVLGNSGFWGTLATPGEIVSQTYALGGRISSNSWGAAVAGAYNANAQAYDLLVRDAQAGSGAYQGHQPMVVIFAAGNSGSAAKTIASPGTAKNIISVGAAESFRPENIGEGFGSTIADSAMDIAYFSSRGPTADGRVKPDLVAPGTHIIGPASQDPEYTGRTVHIKYYPSGQTLYAISSGTSQAAPAVAGAASLVYQYYQQHFGTVPSPAMVKAYLINATRYLNGSGAGGNLPSNNQGYGEVNLANAFGSASTIASDQEVLLTSSGQIYEIRGAVADNSKPLRITLAWTDSPGPTVGNAYVNNLDLEVEINGQLYKGNIFSGAYSAPGGTADVRNNVEAVFLPAGTQGAFTVRVRAANIAGDGVPGNSISLDQDFALIVSNGIRSLTQLNSNIVLNNRATGSGNGGGIYAGTDGRFALNSNFFYGNTSGSGVVDPYGNVPAGTTDRLVDPGVIDPANGNFHLAMTSPAVSAGDSSAVPGQDFEGDRRPQGGLPDVGADENVLHAEVDLSPDPTSPRIYTDLATVQGKPVTFTHTITNLGYSPSMRDVFTISLRNSDGWPTALVGAASPVSLGSGESLTFQVVVTVPSSITELYNRTWMTATSQASAAATDSVLDILARPGLQLTPTYTENADPGEVLTYTHILTNSGGAPDTVVLSMRSPLKWGTWLSPVTQTLSLAPRQVVTIQIRVQLPVTAPVGMVDVMSVTARSQDFPAIAAVVTDTTTANATVGTRHVAPAGVNEQNNCTQALQPCRTVSYAVSQAAWGDTVKVAQGIYNDNEVVINQNITLRGGYRFDGSSFIVPEKGFDPTTTVIDMGRRSRGLRIQTPAGSRPVVESLTIRNGAASGFGGAIYVQGNSAPTLTHLILTSSSASQGGGIYLDQGQPVLQGVVISSTTASDRGGGVYINGGVQILDGLTISGTRAVRGGGIYVQGGAVTISRTMLISNSADIGGGVYHESGSLALWNNFLVGNAATAGHGGGVYQNQGPLDVYNDSFYGNRATGNGGALYDLASPSLTVWNSIFMNNQAAVGGGVYRQSGGSLAADYNDLWGNSAGQSADGNIAFGSHTLTVDPQFIDPEQGNLHLNFDSPMVDIADPAGRLRGDIDEDIRPVNQGFDIGADEVSGCLARIVRQPEILYGQIQDAIDASMMGDTIQIAGNCLGVESRMIAGETVSQTAFISHTLMLVGGYNSRFSNDPVVEPFTTTLNARGLGRVMVISSTDKMVATVIISRLNLLNGEALGLGGYGGGVYVLGGPVIIKESAILGSHALYGGGLANISGTVQMPLTSITQTSNLIEGNSATYHGGGIYVSGGPLMFAGGRLAGNSAQLGGALYNAGPATVVSRTVFIENQASAEGGAVYNLGARQLTVARSQLISNTAATNGGGIFNASTANLTLVNTILAWNRAQSGAGLYNQSANLVLRHGTFYENEAQVMGGGVYHNAVTTQPIINSSLFINNRADNSGSGIYSGSADPQFGYNDVWGNAYGGNLVAGDGPGNVAVDPLFASLAPTSTLFLHLSGGSPVEDMGDPNGTVLEDIDEDPRPSNRNFDIGADEIGSCYVRINGQAPTYGNVQFAINLTKPGDTLYIAGTCMGVNTTISGSQTLNQMALVTKSLGFQGGFTVTDWTLADAVFNPTTLDAVRLGRLFYISNGAVVTVAGLTLQRGNADQGAAVFINSGTLTVTDSLIVSGTATAGGVLYNQGGAVTVTNQVKLVENVADQGGAFYMAGGRLNLDGLDLKGNRATGDGGVLYHAGGTTILQNSILRNNQAGNRGGTVFNAATTPLWFLHNTVYGNQASQGGGFYTTNATPRLLNSIFAQNIVSGTGHAIYSEVPYAPDYNDVYPSTGGYGGNATAGSHNVALDPLFVNAYNGDFHLQANSPLFDLGDPTVDLFHDHEQNLRPGDQGFDLGAFERPSCRALIVRTDEVFGSLPWAILHSQPNDEIQVSADYPCRGVHPLTVGNQVISQTVHVTHSLRITGGYTYTKEGRFISQDGVYTVLDAQGKGRVLVITNTGGVTMSLFALQNGTAVGLRGGPSNGDAGGGIYYRGTDAWLDQLKVYTSSATYGGGMFNAGTGITLTLVTFYSNSASLEGGGVYNYGPALGLINSEVSGNRAGADGGGIYQGGTGMLVLETTKVYSNSAAQNGGGLYSANSNLQLDPGNRFYNNEAISGGGGGIYLYTGSPVVHNNIFFYNKAMYGGAAYALSGSPSLLHNTFYKNSASNMGGAIYLGNTVTLATIKNSIFDGNLVPDPEWGYAVFALPNHAELNSNDYYSEDDPTLTAADYVKGGVAVGDTNYVLDPDFVSANPQGGKEDFHLASTSGLIDIAADLGVPQDMDRNPRPINIAPDIGADEYDDCLARLESTQQIYGRIGDALAAAMNGDEIRVAMGTCYERVTINKLVTISGSWHKDFAGQTDPKKFERFIATTINAEGQGRALSVTSSGTGTVQLSRLGLSRGAADLGAGLYVNNDVKVHLNDMLVSNNVAQVNGGGIYNAAGSDVDIIDTEVYSNYAQTSGGGIYNYEGSRVHISGGDDIWRNRAGSVGGGLFDAGATLTIYNKSFTQNKAEASNGGGIYLASSANPAELINVLFDSNQARNGGGLYNGRDGTKIYHNTIMKNRALESGGGIENTSSGSVINASILVDNTADASGSGLHSSPSLINFSYSLYWNNELAGAQMGSGNLQTNPRFMALSGFGEIPLLSYNSPGIDVVPNAASTVNFDQANNLRPQICTKDMGWGEYAVGKRSMIWSGVEPGGGQALPGKAITYTFSLRNDSERWLALSDRDSSLGPGTGYTETAFITLTSSTGWAQIVDVINGGNFSIVQGGKNARVEVGPSQYLPGQALIVVRVSIPLGAPVFMTDSTSLLYDSWMCLDGGRMLEDTSLPVITEVAADYSFEIGPDNFGIADPGQTLTYTHYITNLGNVTSTYSIYPKALFYAMAEIISPTEQRVTLAPQQRSGPIVVSMTIKPESAGGLVDLTNVVAQIGNDIKAAADNTTIRYTQGTRYVALTGKDSLVDETPLTGINYPDNNCTQRDISPCRTLQQALAQASDGDVIRIGEGVYTDTYRVSYQSRLITQTAFISKSVTLEGGYNPTDWLEAPSNLSHTTTISPAVGRALYVAQGTTVTVKRMTLSGGSAVGYGGGPGNEDAGGNLYQQGGSLLLHGVRLTNGRAALGAGLYSAGGTLRVQSSIFDSNGRNYTATLGGGGYMYAGAATLWNNTFYQNKASRTGGAFLMHNGALTATNNIIAQNDSGGGSKGLDEHAALHAESATAVTDYNLYDSNLGPNWGGTVVRGPNDKVDEDPLFVNPVLFAPNLDLLKASPARDVGSPATNLTAIPTDYADRQRSLGLGVDIGAYEYLPQAAGLLEPDYTQTTGRGAVLTYTHTLTNLGEYTDTFALALSSSQNWAALLTNPPTLTLAAGTTATVEVQVSVPLTGTGGLTDRTVITATSAANPAGFDIAVDTTVVTQVVGLQFEPDRSGHGVPGTVLVYTHTLTNTGDGPDTFNLSFVSDHSWPVTGTASLQLGAMESGLVTVTLTIPMDAVSTTLDTTTVTATSQSNPQTFATVQETTEVDGVWGVSLEPDYTRNVDLATEVIYTHTLTNLGNYTDTFALGSTSTQGWSAFAPAGPVELGPGASLPMVVTVTVPGGSGGLSDVTVLTATSVTQPAFTDTATDTTNIVPMQGFVFFPDRSGTTGSNSLITYTHTLSNAGNLAVQAELTYTDEMGWPVTISPEGPILLAVNAQAEVVVTVTVPLSMGGRVDHTWITATMVSNPAVSDSVVDTTSVEQRAAVRFEPDQSGQTNVPGMIVYTHTLTNTGSDPDTFALSYQSSQGWPVAFSSTSVALGSGESTPVLVTVTVPFGAGGLTDITVVTATSNYTSAVFDTVVDTTTMTRTLGLVLEPDHDTIEDPGTIASFTHVLTNVGNVTDTVTLSGLSNHAWTIGIEPPLVVLGPGMTQTVAVQVAIPAGVLSDTVDTTVITATSGIDPNVSDTATDTITIRRTAGVLFEPDWDRIVGPGQTMIYTHTLTNVGNSADIFDLTSSSTNPTWVTIEPAGSVTLEPAAVQLVTVTVVVPAGTANGTVDTTIVTATTRSDSSHFDTVTDRTTVAQTAGVMLAPDNAASVSAGSAMTYTHILTNTGDGADTFNLTFSSSRGWATLLTNPVVALGAGETATVQLRVAVPGGAAGGLVDLSIVTATSQLSPAVRAAATNTTTVRVAPALMLEPDRNGLALPGAVVTYVHTLTNTGNATDTVGLTVGSSLGWSALVEPSSVLLGAGKSQAVTVTVTVPAGAISGTVDSTTVTATSGLDPQIFDTALDTTTVDRVLGLQLEPDWNRSAGPGTVVTYMHWLTNTGNYTDNFSLNYTSSAGWGSGLPTGLVLVGPGMAVPVTVTVAIPAGATAGQSDTTRVVATSQAQPTLSDMATDVTSIMVNAGVLLAPNRQAQVSPGTVITHLHTLTNTGDGTDSFTLTMTSSQGWAALLDGPVVTVGAGQTTTVRLAVTIPSATLSGTVDLSVVTATSQFSSAVRAAVVDTTTVGALVAVRLDPDQSGTGLPGTSVTYTHWLTNSGNLTDTFTLLASSTSSWTPTVTPLSVTLAPGASQLVTVTVPVPTGTLSGTVDATTVIAVSGIDPLISDSATDTTTVGRLVGVDVEPAQGRGAQPGTVVVYSHWVTNTGNATDVFTLTYNSSRGWAVLAPTGPITLAPSASQQLTVTVTVPSSATAGAIETTTITATSQFSPAVSDSLVDLTGVTLNAGLLFRPDHSSQANSGTTLTYTHMLTNTGDGLDSFTLTMKSSQNWAALLDNPVIVLNAGQTATVRMVVTIPVGTPAGTTDVSVITATSQFSSAIQASVVNTTSVLSNRGVVLAPDRQTTSGTGTQVVYTHLMTNTGDQVDTFSLTARSNLGWVVQVLPTIVTLPPSGTQAVTVTVTVPGGVVSGTADTTVVTATSQSDGQVFDTTTDVTTITVPPLKMIYVPLVVRNVNENLPDLVVREVRLSPASPVAGQPTTIQVVVANEGPQPVAYGNNFYVDFYVNRSPQQYMNGDLSWGAQGSWFGVGGVYTFTGIYTFSGSAQIYVQVDTDGTVLERSETNNQVGPLSVNVTQRAGMLPLPSAPVMDVPVNRGPRPTPTPMP